MYIRRHISEYVLSMLKQFKILLIIGSRQVGKSTLLKEELSPDYEYVVLDDYLELEIAKKDPALFFLNHPIPLCIDEVQRAPELFLQMKLIVDRLEEKGRIVLTGSQSYRLLSKASDSLSGRICLVQMSSLSLREKNEVDFKLPFLPEDSYLAERKKSIVPYSSVLWENIWKGSMPEMTCNNIDWESFYRSYVRTYLERDVQEIIHSGNLIKFNTFLRCLAARTGELFNKEAIARDVGVTGKTIEEWTSILESSGIIFFLRPYERSLSNRVTKSPKIYFSDTGLVCYLVGWTSSQVAMNGAMSGSLFETFVISEIVKSYYNAGRGIENLYFYRDKDKKEIDLVIEKDGIVYPVEIKKSAHPDETMARNFSVLEKISGVSMGRGCILCQVERLTYLKEDLVALPIEYI